jgi:SAM-dependent methyltransferase
MGISFWALDRLRSINALPAGASVLDIGSSNLYTATRAELRDFLVWYGKDENTDEFASFLDRIANGSAYSPTVGGSNNSFVGELLERAGLRYLSLDIADGYRTEIFDLNRRSLDDNLRGTFDAVINYGTTEHVLNQLNAFRVIHDAAKPGAYMVHSVPAVGYADHGYFTYTPRLFLDIASYNGYELVSCEFQGPTTGKGLFGIVQIYQTYFPALSETLKQADCSEFSNSNVPDIGISVVFRKKNNAGFCVPMEMSTSVGDISANWLDGASVSTAPLSTKQLYRTGASLLTAAVRRTPGAGVRFLSRNWLQMMQRAGRRS